MISFEIKETNNEPVKRLIIYLDEDKTNSSGFKVGKNELYELYSLLREIFDGTTEPVN